MYKKISSLDKTKMRLKRRGFKEEEIDRAIKTGQTIKIINKKSENVLKK